MLQSEKKLIQIKEYLKNNEKIFQEYVNGFVKYNRYSDLVILEEPEIKYEFSNTTIQITVELKVLTTTKIESIKHVFFYISKTRWSTKLLIQNRTKMYFGNEFLNPCKDYFRFLQRGS